MSVCACKLRVWLGHLTRADVYLASNAHDAVLKPILILGNDYRPGLYYELC